MNSPFWKFATDSAVSGQSPPLHLVHWDFAASQLKPA